MYVELDRVSCRWALSAIEWQTAQDDLEAEKNELEQAMQASLRQEEERKSQQTPLEQQSPEQLLAHFKGSLLLAAVQLPTTFLYILTSKRNPGTCCSST